MADYSYDPPVSKHEVENYRLKQRLAVLEAELEEYKNRDIADQMKRLQFSESKVDGYVECDDCAGLFRVEKMQHHRDRCQ